MLSHILRGQMVAHWLRLVVVTDVVLEYHKESAESSD